MKPFLRLVARGGMLIAVLLWVSLSSAEAVEDTTCQDCHGTVEEARGLVEEGGEKLFVDPSGFDASVHSGVGCIGCHSDIADIPHEGKLKAVDCSACHEESAADYQSSLHAEALRQGDTDAPVCHDCHGKHDIRASSDPASKVYHTNLPMTCALCHADPKVVKRRNINLPNATRAYDKSVHGSAVEQHGSTLAANCSDCHGSHDLKHANDPQSSIYRANIPKTCSKCHMGVFKDYEQSVHGEALRLGVSDAPVCTTCHGEHDIEAPSVSTSKVYSGTISKTTCPSCHASERINRKYGLPSSQVTTYQDSFHGLADDYGDTKVANCASCHGVHNILQSTDPKSTINEANIPKTCGKCHPGASDNFAKGKVHSGISDDTTDVILRWVRWLYIGLISVIIGGMLLHNIIDFIKKLKLKYAEKKSQPGFERLNRSERIQHVVMFSSFIILVITGFGLKFHWPLVPFVSGETNQLVRGTIHRAAAVANVVVCLYHVFYLVLSARGRQMALAMMPRFKDIPDALKYIGYNLGLVKEKPKFARFSYIEKFEYLALVWGSIVMVVTGLILWFEEEALMLLPKWGFDVANLVHYYEAILATLAIIVWHFYAVLINPDVAPMNFAWLTGEMPEDEFKHEHALQYEELTHNAESADGKGES